MSDHSDDNGETDFVEGEEAVEEIHDGEDAAGNEEIPNEQMAEFEADRYVQKYLEVNELTFEEALFPPQMMQGAQDALNIFVNSLNDRDAAGEAIYGAIFDAAPSLHSLFKTARSVMAMRFMNGLTSIIASAHNPQQLKTQVESLGFQHLDLEVTVPRVGIFRDAIVDLFEMELGTRFTTKAKIGMQVILNYTGGAYIYIRREYASRIRIIQRSWKTANKQAEEEMEEAPAPQEEGAAEEGNNASASQHQAKKDEKDPKAAANAGAINSMQATDKNGKTNVKVPTSFNEMFLFNAAVMGLGESGWMAVVLEQFHNIVTNVANSYRLQEECDVLSLVLDKQPGQIHLSEFKEPRKCGGWAWDGL